MQIFQNSFRHFRTLAHFGDAQSKMIAPLICVAFIVFINTRKCAAAAASRTGNCIKRVRAQTQIASGNCSNKRWQSQRCESQTKGIRSDFDRNEFRIRCDWVSRECVEFLNALYTFEILFWNHSRTSSWLNSITLKIFLLFNIIIKTEYGNVVDLKIGKMSRYERTSHVNFDSLLLLTIDLFFSLPLWFPV